MEIKFDANQEFQLQAIRAVADLFEGQPRIEAELRFGGGGALFAAIANRLDLNEAEVLANLHKVQEENNITLDPDLLYLEEEIETGDGTEIVRFPNFSVEMETGTGKTYVYLRTALELFRRYGMRKFIVVVPSVAVREGVLKTLQITKKHFRELYDNIPYRECAYDSTNLNQVRQFALSDSVEFMVMTIAAFNKAANVIRRTTDRLQGETPIHLVQATRPILILDEPQNMESEKSIAALAALNPLLALRYSATHRNPYNLVYRLTPWEAYRQGLVKRIEVASVLTEGDTAQPFVRLVGIEVNKRTITARLAVHKLMKSGQVKEKTIKVKPKDSLREKTGRIEYEGYDIDEINPGGQFMRFANEKEISVGEEIGSNREALFEAQIRYTIEEHLRKQARLKEEGVKVLSLFFIDRVANYADDDGIIRQQFDAIFEEVKQNWPEWRDRTAEEVQAAYFAQRRTRSGKVILEDSRTGESEKDRQTYNLIMKEKERLLSFGEPVSFIFSHSALREGWDNPNVCQICTLNQTASDVKKRQEVGRGVRLVLNQEGERKPDERHNVLTVVANESYEHFISQLQSEVAFEYRGEIEARYGKPIGALTEEERSQIEAEYGEGILPPKPADARNRVVARLRKEYTLKPEFLELWKRIRQKTRYAVEIDSGKLVRDVVRELHHVEVKSPRISISKASMDVSEEGAFEAMRISAAKTVLDLAGRYPLPNLVDLMTNQLEHTSPPVFLTRRTLLKIIRQAPEPCREAIIRNPTDFTTEVVAVIKYKLADQLVDGIQYEKISDWYEMTQFETEIPILEEYFVPTNRAIYDNVACDSMVERKFVTELERMEEIRMYVKLPSWFSVDTPIGEYNPDWAIVMDNPQDQPSKPLLYLVRETKDDLKPGKLRESERQKIRCGISHFSNTLGVDFKVVSSASQLI